MKTITYEHNNNKLPRRVHVVAPVPETAPAGQAAQGGVPVLLNVLLAQIPSGDVRGFKRGGTI